MSESKRKSRHSNETDSTRRDLLVAGTAAAGAALLGASVTFGSPQSTDSKSPEGDVKRENDRSFSPAERALIDVWERHTAAEFVNKDADAAIATMTERPVLIHVPVGTGATGREALRKFYAETFIPQMPSDEGHPKRDVAPILRFGRQSGVRIGESEQRPHLASSRRRCRTWRPTRSSRSSTAWPSAAAATSRGTPV